MSSQSLGKQLLNSRARIMYTGGPGWISGWVYDAQLPDIWVSASNPLPKDTVLSVSVQIEFAAAQFEANVVEADTEEAGHRKSPIFVGNGVSIHQPRQFCYKLSVISGIRQQQNKQANRKALHEMHGSVIIDGFETPVIVGDISASGAGIFCNAEIPTGKLVELVCNPDGKSINIQGTIQHCREVPADGTLYSAGIKFTKVGRIEAARWKNRFYDAHLLPSRIQGAEAAKAGKSELEVYAQLPEDDNVTKLAGLIERLIKVSQMERQIIIHNMESLSGGAKETMRAQIDVFAKHEEELRTKICELLKELQPEVAHASVA